MRAAAALLALAACRAGPLSGTGAGAGAGAGTGADGSNGAGAAPACPNPVVSAGDHDWTFPDPTGDRNVLVHVPKGYDGAKPLPLVLNFHGLGSDPTQEALLSGMNAKADAEGFVVAYPRGLNASWNAGRCCAPSSSANVDDVGFVSRLLDRLSDELCVDPKRVFATGISNGGFLTNRLACELSSRIAAIAPVAGDVIVDACTPSHPMAVLHFHGTSDVLVPYDGSALLGFPSAEDDVKAWAARDGCTGEPVESEKHPDASCKTWSPCEGGAEVTLCTVTLGGHTWPGGFPVVTLGYTSPDLDATGLMWAFFARHPLR